MPNDFLSGVQTAVNLGNLQRMGIQQDRADIAAKDEQRKQQLDEINTELNIYKSLQGDPNVPLSARMGLAMKLAKRAGLTNVTPDVFFAHQDAIHNLMDAYQAKDGEKIITALKTLPTDVTADVFKQLESAQKPQQLASFEGLTQAVNLPAGSGAALQVSSQGQQEVFQALVDPTQKARATYLNTQAMKIAVDAQLSAARVNEVQNKVKQYRAYTAPLEEMKLIQEEGKTEELDEKRNLLRASNKAFAKWYDDRPRLIQTAQGELDHLRARATQLAPWVVNSQVGIALPEGKTPAMVQAELLNTDRDIELKEREVAFLENPTPQTFKIYEDSYKSLNKHLTDLVKKSDQIAEQKLELSSTKYGAQRADATAQADLDVLYLKHLGNGFSDAQAAFKAMEEIHAKYPNAALKNPIKTPSAVVNIAQEKAEAAKVGGGFGAKYIELQDAAVESGLKLQKLDRMEQLLTGMTTGALTPTITQIQAIGEALGFRVDPTLPAKQALEALSNEISLTLRNPAGGAGMPGALSDKDREFLKSMTPGLAKTVEGNKLIIETMRSLLKREQVVAKMARAYRTKHGQFDEGFFDELEKYGDTHSLFKGATLPAAASGTPTIGTVEDGYRFKGGDPSKRENWERAK